MLTDLITRQPKPVGKQIKALSMITIPQKIITVLAVLLFAFTAIAHDQDVAKDATKEVKLTSTEVLASSQATDWRQP
jgi:hypothetical protein